MMMFFLGLILILIPIIGEMITIPIIWKYLIPISIGSLIVNGVVMLATS